MLAFIFDHQRQRRAGGVAVVIAAEETEFVRFLPLGGDASAGRRLVSSARMRFRSSRMPAGRPSSTKAYGRAV